MDDPSLQSIEKTKTQKKMRYGSDDIDGYSSVPKNESCRLFRDLVLQLWREAVAFSSAPFAWSSDRRSSGRKFRASARFQTRPPWPLAASTSKTPGQPTLSFADETSEDYVKKESLRCCRSRRSRTEGFLIFSSHSTEP